MVNLEKKDNSFHRLLLVIKIFSTSVIEFYDMYIQYITINLKIMIFVTYFNDSKIIKIFISK